MKITAKQYALSLFESIKDVAENEVEKIIVEFTRILAKNNDISKIDEIIDRFMLLWNREKGEVEAQFMTIGGHTKELSQAINDYIKARTRAKKVNLREITDMSILGGFILKYANQRLDNSLRSRINEIRAVMKK